MDLDTIRSFSRGKNRGIAEAKKEQRRIDAGARKERYDNLSPKEKIRRLDARLGKGVGAKKERSRILASWNKPGDGKEHVQETRIEDLPRG